MIKMSTPCEIAVKCVLPAVRALTARELIQNFGLKQAETAKKLGISQSAISHYIRKNRGTALDLKEDAEIYDEVKEIAAKIYAKENPKINLISRLCKVCKIVRKKRLMCTLHGNCDAELNVNECEICQY